MSEGWPRQVAGSDRARARREWLSCSQPHEMQPTRPAWTTSNSLPELRHIACKVTPRPLGSTRITEFPSYYEAVRPCALRSVLYLSLVLSLRISHHDQAANRSRPSR